MHCCKSIKELQEQNQKLLAVVRELSEEQERNEQAAVDAKTAALTEYALFAYTNHVAHMPTSFYMRTLETVVSRTVFQFGRCFV